MKGTVRIVRGDWILILAQMAAVLIVLGPPSVRDAVDFFTSGFPTGVNTAAAITLLLWIAATAIVLIVATVDIRRGLGRVPSSTATLAAALGIGLCCLIVGFARHEAGVFRPCCGSIGRADASLGATP